MGGFLSHEGGGVRGGLTFVTKKVGFFFEGFPYYHSTLMEKRQNFAQDLNSTMEHTPLSIAEVSIAIT